MNMEWKAHAKKTLALCFKDFYLHRLEILGAWAGLCLFIGLLFYAIPPKSVQQQVVALVQANLFMNLVYSEYLIYREKTKGTFVWLRSMPLGDAHIVTAKFAVLAACQIGGYTLSLGLFAPLFVLQLPASALVILLAMICVGCMMLNTRWFFNQRMGMVIPVGVIVLLLGAYVKLKEHCPWIAEKLSEGWHAGGLKVAVAAVEIAWILLMWHLMVRLLGRRDTPRLVN